MIDWLQYNYITVDIDHELFNQVHMGAVTPSPPSPLSRTYPLDGPYNNCTFWEIQEVAVYGIF